jgi:stearoyl-CoA desaturase (delta-9 desaturase)
MFTLHHVTWLINSAAHTWGWKPFCQEQSAVDNFFLSLVTFGEGYHNYHHTFANDYRNGVRWYHFDPTKWMIWTLSKLGLASHLRRTDQLVIKRRMVLECKSLLLQRLETAWEHSREELKLKVQELSDRLLEHLTRLNDLGKQMAQSEEQVSGRELMRELMSQMRSAKRALKRDWHQWSHLSKNILRQEGDKSIA